MSVQYRYPRYPRTQRVSSDPLHGSDLDVAALSDLEDEDEEEECDEEGDEDGEEEEEEEEELPYPGFVAISLKYLDQKSRPRNWCLAMITNPYPLIAFLVIITYYKCYYIL